MIKNRKKINRRLQEDEIWMGRKVSVLSSVDQINCVRGSYHATQGQGTGGAGSTSHSVYLASRVQHVSAYFNCYHTSKNVKENHECAGTSDLVFMFFPVTIIV